MDGNGLGTVNPLALPLKFGSCFKRKVIRCQQRARIVAMYGQSCGRIHCMKRFERGCTACLTQPHIFVRYYLSFSPPDDVAGIN